MPLSIFSFSVVLSLFLSTTLEEDQANFTEADFATREDLQRHRDSFQDAIATTSDGSPIWVMSGSSDSTPQSAIIQDSTNDLSSLNNHFLGLVKPRCTN